MLRAFAIAVVVANLLVFGYTRGGFDGVFGLRAEGDREPERMARQLRPETLRVVPAASSSPASTASAAGGACFESVPVAEADGPAAETALRAALPAGRWIDVRSSDGTTTTRRFRVEAVDAELALRLAGLKLDAAGRIGFVPCAAGRS